MISELPEKVWDLSSAGRASALQAEGHRFEPYRSHYCIVTINIFGWIPEWPKGTDCKSAANCFGGSNPPPSIRRKIQICCDNAKRFVSISIHLKNIKIILQQLNIIPGWSSLEARRAHNPKVVGSNPAPAIHAQIAQLVEQRTENPRVAGSIPALGIVYVSLKLHMDMEH